MDKIVKMDEICQMAVIVRNIKTAVIILTFSQILKCKPTHPLSACRIEFEWKSRQHVSLQMGDGFTKFAASGDASTLGGRVGCGMVNAYVLGCKLQVWLGMSYG